MEAEKKEAPTFFYNENKDPDPDMKGHFFITQIQTLFIAILITGLMQLSNHLAMYLIYCCPMYFFLVLIQYFAFWKPEADLTVWFNLYNFLMFIICLPIFFGVFFGVFHPSASLEFTKVQNCHLIGSLNKWIEQTEKYSILYINFEHEGKKYLGSACASDFYEESTTQPILPYKFYYKYDGVACGSIENVTDPQYQMNRLLSQNYLNQTELNYSQRILRTGGGGHSSGGGSHSSGSHSSGSHSSSNSCYRDYTWSKVKIASWLCSSRNYKVEDLMQPQSCYVNFFTGDRAYENGQKRAAMKDVYNFPLIAYKPHAYYPKADLVCLILFSYYNWILAFNSIFQYTANYILKLIRKTSQQAQQNVEQKANQDPIHMEQINKDIWNPQTNGDLVNQQQIYLQQVNGNQQNDQYLKPTQPYQESQYLPQMPLYQIQMPYYQQQIPQYQPQMPYYQPQIPQQDPQTAQYQPQQEQLPNQPQQMTFPAYALGLGLSPFQHNQQGNEENLVKTIIKRESQTSNPML